MSGFERADMNIANRECGPRPGSQVFDNCPVCSTRVALHCDDCKTQVTGCLCSEQERFGKDEAWRRAVQRWGHEVAKERLSAVGFWVPEN